ncbi:hypothetical protein BDK51DRAFT_31878 [Blyttiomyces helicus]|uniref:Uncharacterized protein n=1 Tax=Blyttiomyces helicus TaxID=388810 RepID=A0A4P9WLK4_9FUNG|nr:hypothetical protein BDK51DRAFT_31878 [Blyttiomyces helicus]|eukprot:RKO92508.1 hypothetical protein BDK51DRAFT_31878 [Blyttiomyces helicus]
MAFFSKCGGTVKEARPLNKWSRAYVHAKPVPCPPPNCLKGILDIDMDDDIYDFDFDSELSNMEEKYEAGEETPQLEKNSAADSVYDGGMRDEEERRKSDSPEKVFCSGWEESCRGFD